MQYFKKIIISVCLLFVINSNAVITYAYVSSKTHTNHVGIYIGKDNNGNDLWCHEKGHPESNVVVNNYDKFTIYYRIIN